MSKQLMIKPEKCISCRTCELVCSFGHYQEFNPKLSNVTVMDYEKAAVTIPVMCMQCEEPACMLSLIHIFKTGRLCVGGSLPFDKELD